MQDGALQLIFVHFKEEENWGKKEGNKANSEKKRLHKLWGKIDKTKLSKEPHHSA